MRYPTLDPDVPIIDAHHHLWDGLGRHALGVGNPLAGLSRTAPRYLLDELLADITSGHRIRATVYVESGFFGRASGPEAFRPVGETEFAAGVAAMGESGIYGDVRPCAAIVCRADLTIGAEIDSVLAAQVQAAGGRLRGVRVGALHDPDPTVLGPLARRPGGFYADPDFRDGLRRLCRYGLSFEATVFSPQLEDVVALATDFPEQPIILDHIGIPLNVGRYRDQQADVIAAWTSAMRRLAECANVSVKLGGFGMPFFGEAPPAGDRPDEALGSIWRPYIETVVSLFGVERCMFESNFPVDSLLCDYVTLWNGFKLAVRDYSPDEKAALFHRTAAAFYNIPDVA